LGEQAQWVCLQKELRTNDMFAFHESARVRFLGTQLPDFDATAALLELMDLVITVDTGVAHLAGAMGKPVWILLPFVADWRWLSDRDSSPWYPTARLFRQPRIGDWTSVINDVKLALQTLFA